MNVVATSLPLECCDCLDWSKKKYKKDPSQPHQEFKSQVCHGGQKLLFSIHFLCLALLPHSLHSRQPCKVYKKGASPLPSFDTMHCINCLPSGFPLPSPVCIFPTVFHAGLRIWIMVTCFISNRTICMNLLLCSMLVFEDLN